MYTLHRLSADKRCLMLFIVVVSMRCPLDVTGSFLDRLLMSHVIICEDTVSPYGKTNDPLYYNLDRAYKLMYKLLSTIHLKQTLASKEIFANVSSGQWYCIYISYLLLSFCHALLCSCKFKFALYFDFQNQQKMHSQTQQT